MQEILINKIIRSRRKTLGLQITPDSRLIVRAPQRASEETILRIVEKKRPWILNKQRIALETYRPARNKEFISGEGFSYLGETYKLFIVEEADRPLIFDGHEFKLHRNHLSQAYEHFTEWYKNEAINVITKRVARYADIAGLSNHSKITITNATKRWGSCSHKGSLNFSWRLVMAPMKIIDYVVVHELMHLREYGHSQKFWESVSMIIPDYKLCRNWLKNHAVDLTWN